jgi:TIR domain
MSGPASGRVFISYRRKEASGMAGRLYDRLAARFGDDQVFMDVDNIALGVDFAEVIAQAVSTSRVLLAVIGPSWLTATDQDGRRRLEDPNDLVRLEIAAALERDIRVIPILVEDAVMPRRQELPENLAELADRQALRVRHESFRSDTDQLLAAIERKRRVPSVRLFLALAVAVTVVGAGLGWVISNRSAGPFRDDFAARLNGWDEVDDPKHRLRYADGTYQMLARQRGDYYSFPRSRYEQLGALQNVLVEVDARKRSGTTEGNGYGVVCSYHGAGDLYWFNITNDGYYGINKKVGGTTVRLQPPARTDAIRSTGLNHIQAKCARVDDGGAVKLVLKVNDRQIAEATDDNEPLPAGGGVGLFAHNTGDGPVDFVFDNFAVRRP